MNILSWYVHRLQAMNLPEIFWRLKQKRLQYQEKKRFKVPKQSVSHSLFNSSFSTLQFNENLLGICFMNTHFSLNTEISLLGEFEYKDYKKKWHAGFQTEYEWPLIFSYQLNYKQNDQIGDARTNWELNRHFQFTLLAKNLYAAGKEEFEKELYELFTDWNKKNPFLYGISWTSTMEIAIRSISWIYTLAFLQKYKCKNAILMEELKNGIINMTEYISKHYSRFSSANNHLIIEAAAIGLAGFAFNYAVWKDLAIEILTSELDKQNYRDGVNKEMSLHYQTFVMEAYGLMMHTMQSQSFPIPLSWYTTLNKMCEFVSYSLWNEQTACEFGDNDEGKILDLSGGSTHSYNYVLQLCSLVLKKRYHSFKHIGETIHWLFTSQQISIIQQLPVYNNSLSKSFKEGGISFLKDHTQRILIGIDHAALGFGKIAAHGHADALSFQLLINGIPILTDPGTYIYHCKIEERNKFRKTLNHNTISINEQDQSEMLGAFLWGKKAITTLHHTELTPEKDIIIASHDGYLPVSHKRKFSFDKTHYIQIEDNFSQNCSWTATFIMGEACLIKEVNKTNIKLLTPTSQCMLSFQTDSYLPYILKIEEIELSPRYGKKVKSKAIRIKSNSSQLITHITIN